MNSGMLLRIGIIAVLVLYGVLNFGVFLWTLVISILVSYVLGRVLQERSRLLQIIFITIFSLIIFLFIAVVSTSVMLGFYRSYPTDDCPASTAQCVFWQEPNSIFPSNLIKISIWFTIPKPLRPACETISPSTCGLNSAPNFALGSYFVGFLGVLMSVFIIFVGLRQQVVHFEKY